MKKRKLILEDGTVFHGTAFGDSFEVKSGEVIFNSAMTGYQEIISDPNYYGSIVVMTYPSIGTYGINRDDFESITPTVSGIVVKEVIEQPSNFRTEETLDHFLKNHQIPGIANIDTRMLTRILRKKGTMKGIITDEISSEEEVIKELKSNNDHHHFVKNISVNKPYIVPGQGKRIVVVDLGMKQQILNELTKRNCHVTVVPYDYDAENIKRLKPDGILLSNGPGNPSQLAETKETVKQLLGEIPIFSIGIGHQVFALACGAETTKLKVGKYGSNYAVKELKKDKTWMAAVSHHYIVDEKSCENNNLEITYRSLNDGTIEGLSHQIHSAFSVQFNPEGAPGSNETSFLFDEFLQMTEQFNDKTGGNSDATK